MAARGVSSVSGYRCLYTFRVVVADACLSLACTTLTSSPAAIRALA